MYALALLLEVIEILNTMLSPAVKLQVEGSAAPVAWPGCQLVWAPVETVTALPHGVIPVEELLR